MKVDSRKTMDELLQPFREMAMFEDCELTSPESTCPWGDAPVHVAAYENNVETLRAFLPFVHDLNIKGELQLTPLHSAILHGSVEAADMLIAAGADVECMNHLDENALTMMAGKPAFIDMARKYGLQVSERDEGE